jgi:hypothetical protein
MQVKRLRSIAALAEPMHIEPDTRPCARRGCANAGTHRAPRSRAALGEYVWFCLDHVREYNAAWNYCAGMSEAEIERRVRRDTVWERPSWRFGAVPGSRDYARAAAGFAASGRVRLNDGFGTIFGDGEPANGPNGHAFDGYGQNGHGQNGQAHNGHARANGANGEMARALAVLGLEAPVTRDDLKARYKALAKRLHPDANGGDRAAEERLKDINLAYASLRKCDLIQ